MVKGGMHGEGVCVVKMVRVVKWAYMAKGRGMCGRGVCMARGGMHGGVCMVNGGIHGTCEGHVWQEGVCMAKEGRHG